MRLLPILPYSLLKDVFIFPSRIDPINDYSGYSSSFSTFNLYWRHMFLQIPDVSGFEKPAGLKKPSGLLQIQCNLKKPEGPSPARPWKKIEARARPEKIQARHITTSDEHHYWQFLFLIGSSMLQILLVI